MQKRCHKKFRKLVKELREMCPTIVPVRVRRRPIKDLAYTTVIYDDDGKLSHFNIVLDNRISWDATWQLLIHEWAHAIAWIDEDHPTVTDHAPEWGIALSRIYCEVIEI